MENLKMKTYFPAFVCVLCLIVFAVICLGTGLGLINPFLGVTAILCVAFAMFSIASDINE
jgi:hypothetical protein